MSRLQPVIPGGNTATTLNVSYRVGRIAPYLSGRWLDYGCAEGGYSEALRIDGDQVRVARKAGKLANLEKALAEDDVPWSGTVGMGHTRWATHGGPTDGNAHPHVDCTGTIAVVHNGIIENFAALRSQVERRGHTFTSDTDTEIVAHLLEERLAAGAPTIAAALREVCRKLTGAFTLVVTSSKDPDTVVAARRNSPPSVCPR